MLGRRASHGCSILVIALVTGCATGGDGLEPQSPIPGKAPMTDERPTESHRELVPEGPGESNGAPRVPGDECDQTRDVGSCDGDLVTRCIGGYLDTVDCREHGRVCGLVNSRVGMGCILEAVEEPPTSPPNTPPPNTPPPADPCRGVDQTGLCNGGALVWCSEDNQLEREICADDGLVCGWDNTMNRWDCIADQEPGPSPPAPPEGGPPPAAPMVGDDCGSAIEAAVVQLANESRSQNGAGQLACDPALTAAARRHSEDMCAQNYFDHTGRDGSSAGDRMRRAGAQFRTWAENIAYGYGSADRVHTGWMNSPGHRRNLLNGSLGRVGVGYADCNGDPYWTQVFAD